MSTSLIGSKEGGLGAPVRNALPWQEPDFHDAPKLYDELGRVFDICHGCRRCVNLCDAFPKLFDLIDSSPTLEVDGVSHQDYAQVWHQCYLCDMCYMTKCPYVPPHEWNVDFPQLMLRAKSLQYRKHGMGIRDWFLSSPWLFRIALYRPVALVINWVNSRPAFRRLLHHFGIHRNAWLPRFAGRKPVVAAALSSTSASASKKVAIFTTCYGENNEPHLLEDMQKVFAHNMVTTSLVQVDGCCGMPRLEQGDLDTVRKLMQGNIPRLAAMARDGWQIVSPIPSCTLMFRQQLPLMFPEDADVALVASAFRDPWEYLARHHANGDLLLDFKRQLGRVLYHVPCHQRVQNIGPKTMSVLSLVPGTEVMAVERCSGHDGSYGIKTETHEKSRKICRPVVRKLEIEAPDFFFSDCPLASQHIAAGMKTPRKPSNPFALLCYAYGLPSSVDAAQENV